MVATKLIKRLPKTGKGTRPGTGKYRAARHKLPGRDGQSPSVGPKPGLESTGGGDGENAVIIMSRV